MIPPRPAKVGILHYSAPPVIGGVENVILAHIRLFMEAGYSVAMVAGRGEPESLPFGTEFIGIPELDSQHPQIVEMSQVLEQGRIPLNFEDLVSQLAEALAPNLQPLDLLLVHNVFTKHFNLPLTAALFRLLDRRVLPRCVAWCHDITWTSPNSRSKVQAGYPWDLLRTRHSDIRYVTISRERQSELARLFECPPEHIEVIYNGVDPQELLALSEDGLSLIDRLDLWDSDLNLLMPVRVTQAKNIELALHVVAILKEKGIYPKLIVTGPPDPHDPTNMKYFQHLMNVREQLGVVYQMRFVYEAGREPAEPLTLEMPLVAELLRVSDALFMPSHREGFGMPVLEAGLAGVPVFCSSRVPAAKEIGSQDIVTFSPDADPDEVAGLILNWMENDPVFRLRRRVRQEFTWRGIFQRQILPLLDSSKQ